MGVNTDLTSGEKQLRQSYRFQKKTWNQIKTIHNIQPTKFKIKTPTTKTPTAQKPRTINASGLWSDFFTNYSQSPFSLIFFDTYKTGKIVHQKVKFFWMRETGSTDKNDWDKLRAYFFFYESKTYLAS